MGSGHSGQSYKPISALNAFISFATLARTEIIKGGAIGYPLSVPLVALTIQSQISYVCLLYWSSNKTMKTCSTFYVSYFVLTCSTYWSLVSTCCNHGMVGVYIIRTIILSSDYSVPWGSTSTVIIDDDLHHVQLVLFLVYRPVMDYVTFLYLKDFAHNNSSAFAKAESNLCSSAFLAFKNSISAGTCLQSLERPSSILRPEKWMVNGYN